MRTLLVAAVALAVVGGTLLPAGAQVEEEDLTFTDARQRSMQDLQELFDRALAVFDSIDQPQSVPLWNELIGRLDAPAAAELEIRDALLAASLFRRAEAYFNLGQNAEAEVDLARALTVAPGLAPDEAESSPKLLDLFRRVRDRTIGRLALAVEPADARIELDGVPYLGLVDAIQLLAGPHTVHVSRPGFTAQTAEVEIEAGAASPLGIELERASAVVRVRTNVPDVEVSLDGQPVARTALPLGTGEAAALAESGAVEPFAEALVDGLPLGPHEIGVGRDGYRPLTATVLVEALVDYELPTFTLEETRGTVALTGIPAGARVRIDGAEPATPPAAGELRLELPVGTHEVAVELGSIGAFVERLELADRQEVALSVRLAPRATLLGVLGGDLEAAEGLVRDLAAAFSANPDWRFEDHAASAPRALAEIGVDAAALRAGPDSDRAPDWPAVQDLADRRFTGSVYLLAVLSDDLYATAAEVFLWAASPGPAVPETVAVDLEEPASLAALVESFSAAPTFARPWLGATLLDAADGGVVLAGVTARSPAEAAGVAVGDQVTALGGRAIATRADVYDQLASADEATSLGLSLVRGGTPREVVLAPQTSPLVLLETERELPVAVAAAWIHIARSAESAPPWVLALNEAAAFLRLGAWAEAVRTLRAIEAPAGSGLGQGAVDYWLGVALLETDPAAYTDQARAALERAAASDGRLAHHDGPPVAPRARARLEALE